MPAGVAKLLFLWMRRDESGEMEGKRERRSRSVGTTLLMKLVSLYSDVTAVITAHMTVLHVGIEC